MTLTEKEIKRRDALGLFMESGHKADNRLRGCGHNQNCYNELMEIREHVIDLVKELEYVQSTS